MPTGYTIPTTGPRQQAGAGAGPLTVAVPVVIDRQTIPLTAVESDGQAVVAVPPAQNGYALQVEIIDIWSDSTGTPTASVYINAAAPQNEVDYSSNAGHDIAYEDPAIFVPAGQPLVILWSGLSAGAQCTARVQYSVIRFAPVTYGA